MKIASNYYALVAGLPDLAADMKKLIFNLLDFRNEMKEQLSDEDYRLTELFFIPYDNKNIISQLTNTSRPHEELAILSKEELEEELQTKEIDPGDLQPKTFIEYLRSFIIAYKNEIAIYPGLSYENQLTAYYYDFALRADNAFVRAWFTFERNIKNMQVAINAQKHGLPLDKNLIGDNDVCLAIKNTKSRDYGLSAEYPYMEKLLSLYESNELMKREKEVDLIRWKMAEELTVFNYFSIENILAYLIKLTIVERWLRLDDNTGKELFERLLSNFANSYEVPKEFLIFKY